MVDTGNVPKPKPVSATSSESSTRTREVAFDVESNVKSNTNGMATDLQIVFI